MEKPIELENVDESREATCITVCFNEDTSHYGVLYQAVTELAKNGFASEEEICEEWLNLLQINERRND